MLASDQRRGSLASKVKNQRADGASWDANVKVATKHVDPLAALWLDRAGLDHAMAALAQFRKGVAGALTRGPQCVAKS